MKKIYYALLVYYLFVPLNVVHGAYPTPTSTTTVKSIVEAYSALYEVNPALSIYVAEGESSFEEDQVGDMNILCKRTGLPVRARGVWQITSCFHPEITDSQAFDAEWSTKWAMKVLKDEKLCKQEFTVCRNWYKLQLATTF